MPNDKYLLAAAMALVLMLAGVPTAAAVDIGGEITVESGLAYHGDQVSAHLRGEGQMEFYLPEHERFETRFALRGSLSDDDTDWGIRYLYLRSRIGSGHLTAGRQPVSWGYGSMLNPVGYGLDLEGLAGETVTPAVDGLRYFHSLGGGRSIQAVASFPEGLTQQPGDRLGYGARLRLPAAGRDFSLNMSYQPLELPIMCSPQMSQDHLLRAGASYSGDLGPVGIYGALGYYRLREMEESDIAAQLGIDYSFQIGPEYERRLVYLQAEYLRFLQQNLGLAVLMQIGDDRGLPAQESNRGSAGLGMHDLLLANASVDMDAFTQIGTALMAAVDDGTWAVTPYYQTDLGGDVDLRIQAQALRSAEDTTSFGASAALTYHF